MKATLKTILFPKTNSDGTQSVALRVTHNRKSRYFFLRRSCLPAQWEPTASRFKRNFPNHARENEMLRTYEQRASDIVFEFERTGQTFSFERFAEMFTGESERKATNLADYISEIVADMKDETRLGSARVYRGLGKLVAAFRPKTEMANLDTAWLTKFEHFLRSERRMKDSSIGINLRTLRAVCNRAIKERLVGRDWYPFADYSIARLSKNNVKKALSKETIRALEAATLEPGSVEDFGRDLFIFSFYARGMNLADIAALKPENIRDGRIFYTRKKTGRVYSIAVSEPARAILEKYAGGSFVFPIYSGQHETEQQRLDRRHKVMKQVNAAIRTVAEREGIPTDNLTFYAARHSYATILKREGVSVAVISQALGHADLKTTESYLKQFEDSVIDAADAALLK